MSYDFMAEAGASRADAINQGLKYYQPKRPCPAGHMALRFVSNWGCVECLKSHCRKYQREHREDLLPKKLEWAKNNPEKNREQSIAWQRENKAKAYAIQQAAKQRRADHYRTVGRIAAAKRRAALLQRTPPWADFGAIAQIYKACPQGMEVDHIVPLQGETVSGLHVAHNLQYLTKSVNSGKGARWE